MNNTDYILKSSKKDIAKAISKSGIYFGKEADNAAEFVLEYCPKVLYKNIDEIVSKNSLTNICFDFVAGDNELFTKTINALCSDFYNHLPPIIILIGICYQMKDESGFLWLHDLCQNQ